MYGLHCLLVEDSLCVCVCVCVCVSVCRMRIASEVCYVRHGEGLESRFVFCGTVCFQSSFKRRGKGGGGRIGLSFSCPRLFFKKIK